VLTGFVALLCSYGKKNPEFLKMVPSGLLPVIVLDGRVITESLDIMVHNIFFAARVFPGTVTVLS
jgi:Glutathione S-transferase, N-terminal domain